MMPSLHASPAARESGDNVVLIGGKLDGLADSTAKDLILLKEATTEAVSSSLETTMKNLLADVPVAGSLLSLLESLPQKSTLKDLIRG